MKLLALVATVGLIGTPVVGALIVWFALSADRHVSDMSAGRDDGC